MNMLINELCTLPKETEWVEFKVNYINEKDIGEYLSALSNSACLLGKSKGYLVYGIENETHNIVGTSFKPLSYKIGNQELESWLINNLSPRIDVRISEETINGKLVSVFEVPAATHTPVRFGDTEFIRVGSYLKKLKEYPEKERNLWKLFESYKFENEFALENSDISIILNLIDYPALFELTEFPLPADRDKIIERLVVEKVLTPAKNKLYNVTNLGAVLFAKHLTNFEKLKHKAVRVTIYKGKNKIQTIKEQVGVKGYANGFESLINFINDQLPTNEEIGRVFRSEVKMYPEIAIRELVTNSIIHQDFSISGSAPVVEIFDDRIEITNPGTPLIDTLRFIDSPPISRNEELTSFMRRMKICEERGSGIDKVIFQVELFQLPPPAFDVTERHTKVTLYAYKKLAQMDKQERARACYQHACLQYASNDFMTNQSLRKRFGIEDANAAQASRIIADALNDGVIKLRDPESQSRKHTKYVPFWV